MPDFDEMKGGSGHEHTKLISELVPPKRQRQLNEIRKHKQFVITKFHILKTCGMLVANKARAAFLVRIHTYRKKYRTQLCDICKKFAITFVSAKNYQKEVK
jgi:hypothetical protein